MHHFKIKICATILAMVGIGLFIADGCASPHGAPQPVQPVSTLSPGPNDPRIAYVTARLMEEFQYSLQPLDTEMSVKFYDGYIDSLDPGHENFLQSDIDEFAAFRTNLDIYTVGGRGRANLAPAYKIFARLEERLEQHTAYADELLKQDRFKFDADESVQLDRHRAPWPADLAAAQQLWRQQLLHEFLQQKLSREISSTNSDVILPISKADETEIADKLAHHYNWNLQEITNWDSNNILQVYLNALTHAYDPHSDYLNQEHSADFAIGMSLQLGGIGAQLTEDEGYCTISSLIPGGPAAKNGQIHEKDRIIAVAQSNQPPVNVVDMELSRVVELIRGPKGTQVRLTLMPVTDPTARPVITLTREEVKLENEEASAKLIELPDGHGGTNRLGIIDVPSFYAPLDSGAHNYITVDVAKLIKKLKEENVSGIVLNMRNNPGGSLEEAIHFTGLFIKDGPVVLSRNPEGQVTVDSDTDSSEIYTGPLVVLVNRFSASAAEIAAAALQDYGRALVVGDTSTFGKGTVQSLMLLKPFVWPANPVATNDPGEVKITIRKFYRISGASTQLKGVVSDIILPDVLNYSTDIGESSLDNPLPWDTISSVDYSKLDLVRPYLKALQERSDSRIATNQDFVYIHEDISNFVKLQAERTATLNEQKAIKELQADDARQKARDAERASRPIPGETIYKITLENSELPGLPSPEPMIKTNESAMMSPTNHATATLTTTQIGLPKSPTAYNLGMASDAFQPDPVLDETERILEDYIALSSARRTLIANH
jgi:carboxyl-terminal processing protease